MPLDERGNRTQPDLRGRLPDRRGFPGANRD
jgi:hypothetical protein